jgi:hypothetical protein
MESCWSKFFGFKIFVRTIACGIYSPRKRGPNIECYTLFWLILVPFGKKWDELKRIYQFTCRNEGAIHNSWIVFEFY